jgi:hypothetical protein
MSELEDKMKEVDVEAILEFQRWAVSCAEYMHMRGKMEKSEYDDLKKATIEKKPMDLGYLSERFKRANMHIMELGGYTKKNVRTYFTKLHNAVLMKDPADNKTKESCMSHRGVVVSKEGDEGIVEYRADELLPPESQGLKRRPVRFWYVPEAKIGDKVLIHWRDVVGFVEEKE